MLFVLVFFMCFVFCMFAERQPDIICQAQTGLFEVPARSHLFFEVPARFHLFFEVPARFHFFFEVPARHYLLFEAPARHCL